MFNFDKKNKKTDPQNNPFDMMMKSFREGLYIDALEWARKALEEKSTLYSKGDVYSYMSECYKSYGNTTKVVEYLEKAVESDPKNPDFKCNLGVMYRETGRIHLALEQYEEALKIKPDDVLTLTSIAILYLFLEDFDKSEELFKKAIELKGDGLSRAYGNYALLLAMQKEFKKSHEMLAKAYIFGYENTKYVKKRLEDLEGEFKDVKNNPAV